MSLSASSYLAPARHPSSARRLAQVCSASDVAHESPLALFSRALRLRLRALHGRLNAPGDQAGSWPEAGSQWWPCGGSGRDPGLAVLPQGAGQVRGGDLAGLALARVVVEAAAGGRYRTRGGAV